MQRQGALTLSQVLVPERTLLIDVLLVLAGSAVVGLFAQFTVPLVPVPITGQTFAVLLVGAALGSKRGALALVAYIGEGLVGLPVFQGGNAAWAPNRFGEPYIMGSTAGYLVGFVAAAFVVGWLAERYGLDDEVRVGYVDHDLLDVLMSQPPLRMAALMLVGNVVLYIPGLVWLHWWLTLHEVPVTVWQAGLLPFWLLDLIKLSAASIVSPSAWHFARSARGS